MTKKILFTIALSILVTAAFSQTAKEIAIKKATDSIQAFYINEAAMRYPLLRQAAVSTEFTGNANVKSELNGNNFYEGKVKITKVRSHFNLPIAQIGKNTFNGSVSILQQHFDMSGGTSTNPALPALNNSFNKSSVGLSASFFRADSLFNRPVYYSASISGFTDEASSIKRVTYTGAVIFPLKRTPNTTLSLGLIALIDPSSPIPASIYISYWHKFAESKLELIADLPTRLALRKQLSARSWITLGSELGGSSLFFDFKNTILPADAMYTTLEIKSGSTFEYRVTKKLILGLSGGILSTATSRFFERNEKPNDYFIKNKIGSVPYMNFSVSFLPFAKLFK